MYFSGGVNLFAGLASIVRGSYKGNSKSYSAFGHVVGPIGLDSKVEI